MRTLRRSLKFIGTVLVIIMLLVLLPPTRIIPSLLIMRVNNLVHQQTSLTTTEGITVDMPSGRISNGQNWYPFVLSFDASRAYSKKTGKDLKLTILYNFGAYDPLEGRSRFYEADSPYQGAFYGAYLVKNETEPFAYLYDEMGALNYGALEAIAKYDYKHLVLTGLGAKQSNVLFEALDSKVDYVHLNENEWIQVTSEIKTNSPRHEYQSFQLSYLQYGLPDIGTEENFDEILLYSRVWVRHIDEKKTSIVLYAMSPDKAFLEEMTQEILYETSVIIND